jgi:hypothetical protein
MFVMFTEVNISRCLDRMFYLYRAVVWTSKVGIQLERYAINICAADGHLNRVAWILLHSHRHRIYSWIFLKDGKPASSLVPPSQNG